MGIFFTRLRAHWMRNLLAIIQVGVAVMVVTVVVPNLIPVVRLANDVRDSTVFNVRYLRTEGVCVTTASARTIRRFWG